MSLPHRPIKHKYGSVRCESDGIKFHSKAERNYYHKLKLAKESGEAVTFLMQVPFRLPGGVVYRADFMVFWADGNVEVIDVKGFMTPMSKLKIKQVLDIHNIEVKIVKV